MLHDIIKLVEQKGNYCKLFARPWLHSFSDPCKKCKVTAGRCQRPNGIRPWPQRQRVTWRWNMVFCWTSHGDFTMSSLKERRKPPSKDTPWIGGWVHKPDIYPKPSGNKPFQGLGKRPISRFLKFNSLQYTLFFSPLYSTITFPLSFTFTLIYISYFILCLFQYLI
jgi:hypothetical protein